MQGPKGISRTVHIKGKPEISFLYTLRIRSFSDPLLPQPDHIYRHPPTIIARNTPILPGRVPKPIPLLRDTRVIQEPDSVRVFLPSLVRIGTLMRLMSQRTRLLIWILQNFSRVKYDQVATAVVSIESLQTLAIHVYYTKDVWSADRQGEQRQSNDRSRK